jgi:hypothetical protein
MGIKGSKEDSERGDGGGRDQVSCKVHVYAARHTGVYPGLEPSSHGA